VYRPSRLVAVLAAAFAMLFAAVVPAQATVTLDVGHVDGVWVTFASGTLNWSVGDHNGGGTTERNPADVLLRAKPETETVVGASPKPACLGTPGHAVWILPQIEDTNLLWLGWNGESIGTGVLANNDITLKINAASNVRPPSGSGGVLCVYSKVGLTTTKIFDSSSATFPQSRTFKSDSTGHTHVNWAFTASGIWEVDFTVTATPVGGSAQSVTKTLTFSVD
jgi:surface-anchored protein